jgi:hypothetical protein
MRWNAGRDDEHLSEIEDGFCGEAGLEIAQWMGSKVPPRMPMRRIA